VKYSVITFGCRVNQADSLAIEGELLACGALPTRPEQADLVVVNTCSVTAGADQGARQTIRRVARANPTARIVVTGCYATRRPDEIRDLPGVDGVVVNDDKPKLLSLAGWIRLRTDVDERPAEGPLSTTADRFGDGEGSCGASIVPGVAGRTAFTLRVQNGCAEPCAYCIIPTTRGAPRSLPIRAVLEEVARASVAGFKEIALTGVHLGSYGRDLTPPSSLVELLVALSDLERRSRRSPATRRLFRISSLEPMDCTDEVVALVAESRCFAPHFHLPLQHASNAVLRRMRRPYTVEYYASLVAGIRAKMPHAAIGSDIIVGFPGETDEDFEQLASYLEASPLSHLHVFPYSDRPGTPAATMAGKVPGAVVRERSKRARLLSELLTRRFRDSQLGSIHEALTIDDGSMAVTGNYLKLRIPPGFPRNEWVRVAVLSHHDGELLGGGPLLTLDDELSTGGPDVASAALSD
jgi:threonylcarbamoyladenosine tRNA methylthiotransferase MtaB